MSLFTPFYGNRLRVSYCKAYEFYHAQNSQKETDWGDNRIVQNELNNKIRNAKMKYPEKAAELKANINKPHFWWKTVSELMKGKLHRVFHN